MNDRRFEALIIASRTNDSRSSTEFTDAVMTKITNNEILSPLVRRMSVNKKETLFMKLTHLPKLAIIAIALGSILVLSGTTYAAYKLLWEKSQASVSQPETSASGRQEVSLLFSKCGQSEMPAKYELKKDATITADQIDSVIKAQCELKAINDWAIATYAQGENGSFGDARENETPMVSLARQIQSITQDSITFAPLEGYGYPEESFETGKDVRYIAGGQEVERSTFKASDTIAYVSLSKTVKTPTEQCTTDACREFGEYRGVNRIVALVKLDKPLQDYDQRAWQSLTELSPCMGNPSDYCLGGYSGAVDLYMGDLQNSPMRPDNSIVTKQIEGAITEINGSVYNIKGTSGTVYTIKVPKDVIGEFNTKRSSSYNNQKIAIGSTISARYWEDKNDHSKIIEGKAIQDITFKIEIVTKGGPVKAY